MPKRFLTAEDVRRAGSARELAIDADTLVTPQALEAARAAGIELKSGGGAWSEPAPDRGPDAARAQRSLPHLPEPSDPMTNATGVVVSALGRNRPGVLMEITSALGQAGANVLNLSQSVADGYFQLILSVELPAGGAFADLKQCLECLGGPDDYVVRVMHERVFRFMHRI